MTFDSNRAWQDAVAAVRANRQVLLALGGVFFLLPALLSTMFLSDIQTRILENASKPELLDKLIRENMGMLLGFGLGGMAVQLIGYVAVMALLSDRGRPTVGETIATGLRGLPTLLLAGLIFGSAALALSTLLSAILGSLLGMVGAGIAVFALLVLISYASIKLSLTMPVVVNERVRNPVAALARSWRLTQGNSMRLFGFYSLLFLGYMAIALVATFIVVAPALLLLGQGQASLLVTGLVTGAVGATANVVLTAVLAQVHRQLAGSSADAARTFE
ncbi:lipoyltransferase [Novosphingobium sp. Rr 2-17]|uniref:lipoyltransferase n=1 Tax=Novosphingobium sp. Rr 2-17 TaxID=555793 RepID=UPI0002697AF2|nr:lipoyltransferase [Novosphingobium sp. Rr 2-17]EIZ80698.1 lipoyltransferase [Novosphingobium sp. Rr 2-17]